MNQSNEEKDMNIQQLEKEMIQVTEQNPVLTKTVEEMSSNLKMVSETVNPLKKELDILKDEPGQHRCLFFELVEN